MNEAPTEVRPAVPSRTERRASGWSLITATQSLLRQIDNAESSGDAEAACRMSAALVDARKLLELAGR